MSFLTQIGGARMRISNHCSRLIGSIFACVTLWGTTGCNDDPGTGTVVFTTWGEGYIEDGIPSDAFLDRWSVKFSKFLVAYNDVAVVDQSGKAVAKLEHALVFDLTQKAQGKPKTLASWV